MTKSLSKIPEQLAKAKADSRDHEKAVTRLYWIQEARKRDEAYAAYHCELMMEKEGIEAAADLENEIKGWLANKGIKPGQRRLLERLLADVTVLSVAREFHRMAARRSKIEAARAIEAHHAAGLKVDQYKKANTKLSSDLRIAEGKIKEMQNKIAQLEKVIAFHEGQ